MLKMAERRATRNLRLQTPPIQFPTHHEVRTKFNPRRSSHRDAIWAALATAVAVGAMVWIAYQTNARNGLAQVQKEIPAQHDESVAELQSLKDKIQGRRLKIGPMLRSLNWSSNHLLRKAKFKGFKTTSILFAGSQKPKKGEIGSISPPS
jgi:hypothetical protein